jgi:hypothetical protein
MDFRKYLARPNPEAFTRVGAVKLLLQKLTTSKLEFFAETTCVQCGAPTRVKYGDVNPVFRIGREFLGVLCVSCLTPESRRDLARLRGEAHNRPRHVGTETEG